MSQLSRTLHLALTAALLAAAAPASAQFAEPGVTVLASYAAEVAGDGFGWVAERAGDLDGDGASEYLITAPFNNEAGSFAGKAYLYDGASGLPIHTLTGSAPLEAFGFSVAGGADASGDGVPDYAVGGRGFGAAAGRVVLFSGADHSVLLELIGVPGTAFGFDIGLTGDLDGDGLADLVVGAPLDATGGTAAGRVATFSGASGSVIWERFGQPGDNLGASVTGLGDVNFDRVPDTAAAAPGRVLQLGPYRWTGLGYVFDGEDGSLLRLLFPRTTASSFGLFFIHDAGDVTGDGIPDVFVGDVSDGHAGAGAGAAYVFSGLTGLRRRFLPGEEAGDGFGIGRGAGDVNGDGRADLIVGAWLSSAGAPTAGRCYVISGKTRRVLRTMTLTVPNGQLGFDAIALGDVTGAGLTDYLLTGNDLAYVVAGTPL